MKTLIRHALLPVAASALTAVASSSASAAVQPFNGSYTGTATVVHVVDPAVAVLRFETVANGRGSFDLGRYVSTDVIDMSTGAGAGSAIFTATNGDELHGSFDVQVAPTAVANVVNLLGQATFTGGTGQFSGARGNASFSGTGVFRSATSAIAELTYSGSIALVPEPGTWLLLSAGVAVLARRRSINAPT